MTAKNRNIAIGVVAGAALGIVAWNWYRKNQKGSSDFMGMGMRFGAAPKVADELTGSVGSTVGMKRPGGAADTYIPPVMGTSKKVKYVSDGTPRKKKCPHGSYEIYDTRDKSYWCVVDQPSGQ